jgi:NAD(P)-dependent dehydrogenase (short-subunit alcohol dehydrogenase family)
VTEAAPPERELLGLWDVAALVTGGARSLGRGCALALARAGCHVAIVDIEDASETATEVKALGRRAVAIAADVREPDGAAAMVSAVEDALGPVAVAVNTVGGTHGPKPFLDLERDDWESVLARNAAATLWCCQAEARTMIEHGVAGSIVNLGSLSGLEGAPNVVDYGAANAAVIHMTRSIALELAPHGIRVNCIVPGAHSTETVAAAAASDPDIASWVARNAAVTPLGRLGDPEETGGVAVFLASRLSSYVTGQEIVVDGGMQHTTARPPVGKGT